MRRRRFRHGIVVKAYPPAGTGRDEHGNEVTVWGDAQSIEDCAFAPLPQSEQTGEPHRSAVVDYAHLWGPIDAPLARGWKVDVPGRGSFVVADVVEAWENPHNGHRPGFEAHLEDVEG